MVARGRGCPREQQQADVWHRRVGDQRVATEEARRDAQRDGCGEAIADSRREGETAQGAQADHGEDDERRVEEAQEVRQRAESSVREHAAVGERLDRPRQQPGEVQRDVASQGHTNGGAEVKHGLAPRDTAPSVTEWPGFLGAPRIRA